MLVEGNDPNAPEKEVRVLLTTTGGSIGFSLLLFKTEKSAILSSPSENLLVSVISYQTEDLVGGRLKLCSE